jgi:Restriction endonuclease
LLSGGSCAISIQISKKKSGSLGCALSAEIRTSKGVISRGDKAKGLTLHVHSDYAPPRSWEQFEELCAEVFQSAWRDPALVRHGRAGQRQHGVDIVARNGALYPIGLQCKKRKNWPVNKITTKEIDDEVREALKFKPTLKAFYILTTAPDDTHLLNHVRKINSRHQAASFEIVLLGWNEIVRRATLDRHVAEKHFGPAGGGAPRSPLLATWMMSDGHLEKTGTGLALSVEGLTQDLHNWPSGHFVIRQRESDALIEKLRRYEGRALSNEERSKRITRITLRRELRKLTDAEDRAIRGVTLMLTEPEISTWFLKIWEPYGDLPLAIESYVNNHSNIKIGTGISDAQLRMSPPSAPDRRCSELLNKDEISSIMEIMSKRLERYGATLTNSVSELPDDVRARVATPPRCERS